MRRTKPQHMPLNWSGIIMALTSISRAMTREDLDRSILAACVDVVGAAHARLVKESHDSANIQRAALQAKAEGRLRPDYSTLDADKAGRIDTHSYASIPLGRSTPSATLSVCWQTADHPTADEQMLLEIIGRTGLDGLERLQAMAGAPHDISSGSVATPFPSIARDTQAQKMEAVGRQTATLTHDISNLLAPIMASLELIARSARDDHRTQEHLHVAMQAATSGLTPTFGTLDFEPR